MCKDQATVAHHTLALCPRKVIVIKGELAERAPGHNLAANNGSDSTVPVITTQKSLFRIL